MTIEELNKIIQEELKAYLNEEQIDEVYNEDEDGDDDDIEVTTDEPAEEEGGEAMETLRQIYDMLKPVVEPEEEPEADLEDEEADEEEEDEEAEEMDEAVGYANYTADQVSKVKADADDVNKGLNESVERFKKLANIKG